MISQGCIGILKVTMLSLLSKVSDLRLIGGDDTRAFHLWGVCVSVCDLCVYMLLWMCVLLASSPSSGLQSHGISSRFSGTPRGKSEPFSIHTHPVFRSCHVVSGFWEGSHDYELFLQPIPDLAVRITEDPYSDFPTSWYHVCGETACCSPHSLTGSFLLPCLCPWERQDLEAILSWEWGKETEGNSFALVFHSIFKKFFLVESRVAFQMLYSTWH